MGLLFFLLLLYYFWSVPLFVLLVMLFAAIAFHEVGHYVVAKYFGIGVQEYSVGLGFKLFQWRWGCTRYTIRAFPFAGWVDCADWMDCENENALKALDPVERRMVQKKGGWFSNQPCSERILMLLAGPAFNVLLSVATITLVGFPRNTDAGYLDLFAAAWNVESRAAVAGIPLADNTSVLDHLAGLNLALYHGPQPVLRIFATLNMGLAVLNLMPMLPLDGGQVVWNLYALKAHDHLRGKQLAAARRKSMPYRVGFSLLGFVILIAIQFFV